jgi:hypothetical protein
MFISQSRTSPRLYHVTSPSLRIIFDFFDIEGFPLSLSLGDAQNTGGKGIALITIMAQTSGLSASQLLQIVGATVIGGLAAATTIYGVEALQGRYSSAPANREASTPLLGNGRENRGDIRDQPVRMT